MTKKINEVEKTLYENYNALFFNASEINPPEKNRELFRNYVTDWQKWRNFARMMQATISPEDGKLNHMWVVAWKQNYKHLAKAIRLCKWYRIPANSPTDYAAFQSHCEYLRKQAHQMMELRMEQKQRRKEYLATRSVPTAA